MIGGRFLTIAIWRMRSALATIHVGSRVRIGTMKPSIHKTSGDARHKSGLRRVSSFASTIAIVFALIGPPLCHAQSTPGAGIIQGTVTRMNEDGQPSPVQGVRVTLTPETGAPVLSTATDDHGHYSFKGLAGGSYTIDGTLEGFTPFKEVVKLAADGSVTQDFSVKLSAVSMSVEVQGQGETLSTENANSTPTITNKQETDLPREEQKFKEALPLVPGVVRASNGTLNMKGTAENQGMLLVDSGETVDPVSGSFSIPVPLDAINNLSVSKTPYGAEFGGFSGGLAIIQTKPPSDTWTHSIEDAIPIPRGRDGHLVGVEAFKPRIYVSGPLMKKKLDFTEALDYDIDKKPIRGVAWPINETKTQGFDSFTAFQATLSPRHVLNASVIVFSRHQLYADISSLVPQTASSNDGQRGFSVGATDAIHMDSADLITLFRFNGIQSNGNPQALGDMLLTPNGRQGDFFNSFNRTAGQFQLQPTLQLPVKNWHGHHDIKFGVDLTYRFYSGSSESDPVQILRENSTLAETISFMPGGSLHSNDTEVSEFAQDNWTINNHFTVDLGARLVSQSAGRPIAFGPRVGIAFSPGQNHKTLIHLGSGIFYDRVPLLTTDFTDNPTRVITLFDQNGVPLGPPTVLTNVYLQPGPGGIFTPTANRPKETARNITSSAEVDRELTRNAVFRVSFLASQISNIAVVIPFEGPVGSSSYLGLAKNGASRYYELEAAFNYKLSERDVFSVSYIHTYARGDLNTIADIYVPFEQAVIRPNLVGTLPSSIPDRVVAWGIFALPWRLAVAPVVDIHTGLPYSVVDSLQNYVGAPNSQRFPSFFSLDVKFYREISGRLNFLRGVAGHTARIGFFALNLTNHLNPLDVFNNDTSPIFGTLSGFQHRVFGMVIEFRD